jgi:hypothetical protein
MTTHVFKAGRCHSDRIAETMRDHRRADRSYSDTGVELLELASGATTPS